jgi:NitT/TauT family transport system permease protein
MAKVLRAIIRTPFTWQILIVTGVLSAWQWIPTIGGIRNVSPALDPFFISSPKRLGLQLYRLATGADNTRTVWAPARQSLEPAVAGTFIALVVGVIAGLLVSRVLRPFVVLMNAIPRIVMIPVIILVAGSSLGADITVGFFVVFFLVFFNAFEGGRSVPAEVMENARVLGAGPRDQLLMIRLPYVLVFTFAVLPNAIAFGLTAIVTAELFTGANGLGQLLVLAIDSANSDLTFAIVTILSIAALILITGAQFLRDRILHWW